MPEKPVIREIFEPKLQKAGERWRKLHNEDIHELFFNPSIFG
jgi:hypothetical protein